MNPARSHRQPGLWDDLDKVVADHEPAHSRGELRLRTPRNPGDHHHVRRARTTSDTGGPRNRPPVEIDFGAKNDPPPITMSSDPNGPVFNSRYDEDNTPAVKPL